MTSIDVGGAADRPAGGSARPPTPTSCCARGPATAPRSANCGAGTTGRASTVARSVTSSLDPDDLVQEAYTRIYQSIVARRRADRIVPRLPVHQHPQHRRGVGPRAARDGDRRARRRRRPRDERAGDGRRARPRPHAPGVPEPPDAVAGGALVLRDRADEARRDRAAARHEADRGRAARLPRPRGTARSVDPGAPASRSPTARTASGRSSASARTPAPTSAGATARKVEAHLAECARCAIVASEAKEVSQPPRARAAAAHDRRRWARPATSRRCRAAAPRGGARRHAVGVMQGAVTVLPAMPERRRRLAWRGTAGRGHRRAASPRGVGSAGAGASARPAAGSRRRSRRRGSCRGAGSRGRADRRGDRPLRRQAPPASPRPSHGGSRSAASSRASARWRASPPRASSSPAAVVARRRRLPVVRADRAVSSTRPRAAIVQRGRRGRPRRRRHEPAPPPTAPATARRRTRRRRRRRRGTPTPATRRDPALERAADAGRRRQRRPPHRSAAGPRRTPRAPTDAAQPRAPGTTPSPSPPGTEAGPAAVRERRTGPARTAAPAVRRQPRRQPGARCDGPGQHRRSSSAARRARPCSCAIRGEVRATGAIEPATAPRRCILQPTAQDDRAPMPRVELRYVDRRIAGSAAGAVLSDLL